MSADSAGVDLVPLLDATPEPVSRRVSPDVPYLSIVVPFNSSRWASPSHQTTKLVEPGLRLATCEPFAAERSPLTAADHTSAPGLPAQMSAATARPLSQPHDGALQMICPVRASPIQSAGSPVDSDGLKTSRPGLDGMKSPTCRASPWWVLFCHSPLPLSSMAIDP